MGRIKFVGYIDIEELDAEHTDPEHESGLSSYGYEVLVSGEEGTAIKMNDLEDVEVTYEQEN